MVVNLTKSTTTRNNADMTEETQSAAVQKKVVIDIDDLFITIQLTLMTDMTCDKTLVTTAVLITNLASIIRKIVCLSHDAVTQQGLLRYICGVVIACTVDIRSLCVRRLLCRPNLKFLLLF